MSSKWDRQIRSLSDRQISLARAFQSASITTYSQAIKALANHDSIVDEWKRQLPGFAPKVTVTAIVECPWHENDLTWETAERTPDPEGEQS